MFVIHEDYYLKYRWFGLCWSHHDFFSSILNFCYSFQFGKVCPLLLFRPFLLTRFSVGSIENICSSYKQFCHIAINPCVFSNYDFRKKPDAYHKICSSICIIYVFESKRTCTWYVSYAQKQTFTLSNDMNGIRFSCYFWPMCMDEFAVLVLLFYRSIFCTIFVLLTPIGICILYLSNSMIGYFAR